MGIFTDSSTLLSFTAEANYNNVVLTSSGQCWVKEEEVEHGKDNAVIANLKTEL
jgi:hypothetical protein